MQSATFESGGLRLRYYTDGSGPPIVLVHGFAASAQQNWVTPGWFETLTPLRHVFAIDCRGHGESEKPHDPHAYDAYEMTDDVVRLMDHVEMETADLFGYSMGAGIALRALVRHPDRFTSLVLGGIGEVQPRGGRRPGVAGALLAPVERGQLAAIRVPVLAVNGADDMLAGTADTLVRAIPAARLVVIPGRDHLTVVGDQRFKDAVVQFLSERLERAS